MDQAINRGRSALLRGATTVSEIDEPPAGDQGSDVEKKEQRPFQLIPFPGRPNTDKDEHAQPQQPLNEAPASTSPASPAQPPPPISLAERTAALNRAMAELHGKWGPASVRLGADDTSPHPRKTPSKPSTIRARELPAWWPRPGLLPRPLSLELVGDRHGAPLTLALAWLAAARPTLAAVVEDPGSVRFHVDAAAGAGLPLDRLVIVRPPPGDPRVVLDAAVILLRSEAFDVILCPLPVGDRTTISTMFANKLATLATKAGTTLLLLTGAGARGRSLGAAAEYRVRSLGRRWVWEDGELAGMKLRLVTERARAAGGAELGGANDLTEHEITLRMHRRARHGPAAVTGIESGLEDTAGDGGDVADRPTGPTGGTDRLRLAAAVRIARREQPRPAEEWRREAVQLQVAR